MNTLLICNGDCTVNLMLIICHALHFLFCICNFASSPWTPALTPWSGLSNRISYGHWCHKNRSLPLLYLWIRASEVERAKYARAFEFGVPTIVSFFISPFVTQQRQWESVKCTALSIFFLSALRNFTLKGKSVKRRVLQRAFLNWRPWQRLCARFFCHVN